MTLVDSKSTDKLMAIESLLERTPMHRIKEIDIVWQDITDVAVPFLHVEYYDSVQEDQPEEKETSE